MEQGREQTCQEPKAVGEYGERNFAMAKANSRPRLPPELLGTQIYITHLVLNLLHSLQFDHCFSYRCDTPYYYIRLQILR